MRVYHNPTTGDTAILNSDKADKDGNIWVEINNALPIKMSYDEFITKFTSMGELKS